MLPNVLQVHLRKCEKNNPSGTMAPGPAAAKKAAAAAAAAAAASASVAQPMQLPSVPCSAVSDSLEIIGSGPAASEGVNLPLPQSSPLPQQVQQQGFLDTGPPPGGFGGHGNGMGMAQFNNGSSMLYTNQRYDGPPQIGMGGMPTPPFHNMGEGGPMYDQQQYMQHPGVQPPISSPGMISQDPYGGGGGSASNNLPAHFLAHEKPLDKGGGSDDGSEETDGERSADGISRPHVCEICEKRFSQKCNLITHMRLHTGERPYICPSCDKRFTQKGNLDAHLKTHVKETTTTSLSSRLSFGCVTCGKKFSAKTSLLSHARQAHHFPGSDPDSMFDDNWYFSTDLPPSPSFSPGIPTPQSSLDSLSCYPGGPMPMSSMMEHQPLNPSSMIMMMSSTASGSDPLSQLTATVEATVPSLDSSTASSLSHITAPRLIS
jgi:hypothetical protein